MYTSQTTKRNHQWHNGASRSPKGHTFKEDGKNWTIQRHNIASLSDAVNAVLGLEMNKTMRTLKIKRDRQMKVKEVAPTCKFMAGFQSLCKKEEASDQVR